MIRGLIALMVFAAAANAQNRDKSIGKSGEFDYYVLSISWSPEYCIDHGSDSECAPDRHYGFVLHGLWPQYNNGRWPQFCTHAAGLRNPASMLDIMPSPDLVRHEWERHGTCSGLSAEQYFQLARRAFQSVHVPSRFVRPSRAITISPAELERELVTANAALSEDAIAVQCRRQYLTEVRVCLSKDLKPIACDSERSCTRPSITLPPVR